MSFIKKFEKTPTPPEKWKDKFKQLDESGESFLFFKKIDDIIKEAIEKFKKGKKPVVVKKEERWLIEKYEGIYETSLHGWPIRVSKIEKGVGTPEYAAKQFNINASEVKKMWGGKEEIVRYGATVALKILDIDEGRALFIEKQKEVEASYGEFLTINDKNCPSWPYVKFDIDLTKLNKKGFLKNEELYNFIGNIIKFSKDCNAGISVKILHLDSDQRIFFSNSLHLYPYFKENLNEEKILEKLFQFYKKGKEVFGHSFDINRREISEKYLKIRSQIDKTDGKNKKMRS